MTQAVTIKSNDGKSNLSAETWAAWNAAAVPVATPAGEVGGLDTGTPVPTEELTGEQVDEMLVATSEWHIAVKYGDTNEVLEQGMLAEKLATSGAAKPQLKLRAAQDSEEELLKQAVAEVAGSSSRIKESKSLPVASAALLATVGGGFGYVAAKDDLPRPEFMLLAAGVGLMGILFSLYQTYWLTVEDVPLTRLDLLRARSARKTHRGVRNGRIATGVFVLALILALAALVGGEEDNGASATISSPSTTVTSTGLKAEIPVKWENLGETAVRVRTTVQSGGQTVSTKTDNVASGAATQTIVVELPAATTIDVRTEALDDQNQVVGQGVTKGFEVP